MHFSKFISALPRVFDLVRMALLRGWPLLVLLAIVAFVDVRSLPSSAALILVVCQLGLFVLFLILALPKAKNGT